MSTGIQRIAEMRVRTKRLYISLEASKPASCFDGGRKDPPVKEFTTVRGPIIEASYWTSRTVPEVVRDMLRISTPSGRFGTFSEDPVVVDSAMRSNLCLPSN